ncbi:hypothetical protein ISF_01847 [Cordyceps fumosorosea ARSEF 2679]|uniref:Uncharacterized protein n=1 Tax=Cordyceps fumosorosea (strain ARSEF 2679) TaxID=1081104 RepID=A0A168CEY2_CORFA|nr:hypothetical protein ISF_01847 [Cordyceps fumosorosea ARSEF 2679]OAA71296.1 hypothetical protein ISF_01847 [Cordyceps fumosorosea ARSEF 2679]
MISSVRSTGIPFPGTQARALPGDDDPDVELIIAEQVLTVCLTIFIFRGEPDTYYNRHVLLYISSPDDPGLHETVHVQREDEAAPWKVYRLQGKTDWSEPANYLAHVNAGAVLVRPEAVTAPGAIIAATPVTGRHNDGGWNCQNFLLEGLQEFVRQGLQSQAWYDAVEEELLDKVIEDAVG